MSKLRFAALCRVSTEGQEKKGESLAVQRQQIEAAAATLQGEVVAWYGGQEHATAGFEKKEIDRLLQDAQKPRRAWDAFIVSDADRWSRDNEANQKGLNILSKAKVRFFVGGSEYDLFKPEHCLFLGMSAVFGSFQAQHQKRKSLMSRIKRAKRGVPTGGKLPFGRTFDPATEQWGIDPEKHKQVQDAARRYLAGEPLPQIAEEYHVNHSNLHKTLMRRCGTDWVQNFKSKELNIDETVPTTIPRLLPDKTIKALHDKAAGRRTFHGKAKNAYLLASLAFCNHCGYGLWGQTNRSGKRYYRHVHHKRERECPVKKTWIPADEIEQAVVRHLFDALGNPKAMQDAIQAAIPNLQRTRNLQERVSQIDGLLQKQQKGREKVTRLVLAGKLDEDEAGRMLDEAKDTQHRLAEEREQIVTELANAATQEEASEVAKAVASKFRRRMPKSFTKANARAGNFDAMTWDEQRHLCKEVFAGKGSDGRPNGVYVTWGKDEVESIDIRGLIEVEMLNIPYSGLCASH